MTPTAYTASKLVTKGSEALTEAELLGLILGDDDLGVEVVKRFSGLYGIANQPLERFLAIHGMGEARVVRLAACFEIAKRCCEANQGM